MKSTGSDAHASAVSVRRARPSFVSIGLPFAVFIATIVLIGWTVWPFLRPARTVPVTQALFDRASSSDSAPSDALVSASPVSSASLQDAPVGRLVQAAGWLEAEPFSVACTALADGVVDSIDVLEGDRVEAGQIVARLVSIDSELRLRDADADLARAKAEVSRTAAEVQAATTAWEQPVALERAVAVGQASLDEGHAELAQLPFLIDSARARLVSSEDETARIEASRESGAASEIEFILASQRAAADRADLAALSAREAILAARIKRLEAQVNAAQRDLTLRIDDRRRLDTARAALEVAEANVAKLAVKRDQAALELERMVIRAPIDGFVQHRFKVPGDKVIRMMDDQHSTHIVHLYDPNLLQVRVDVPLADASALAIGQKCEVIVEVLPDRTFAGEVIRILHEADLQKNTLQVKVRVTDPDPILRPEMLTRVRFLPGGRGAVPAGEATNRTKSPGTPVTGQRVRVHVSSVIEHDDGADVWAIVDRRNGRGTLRRQRVDVVARSDDWVTLEGELAPGALLAVASTGDDFRDGELVVIGAQTGGAS